jgi:hypothetical protein
MCIDVLTLVVVIPVPLLQDLIDYAALTSEDKLGNLNLAFDVALKHLGVPRILDAEDIANMPRPDERSVMTYVAQLYNVFASMDKVEHAGRRLGKVRCPIVALLPAACSCANGGCAVRQLLEADRRDAARVRAEDDRPQRPRHRPGPTLWRRSSWYAPHRSDGTAPR